MIITISVHRLKYNNKIAEVFTWTPKSRLALDPHRKFYHILRDSITTMAIHKEGFFLLSIRYEKEKVIYFYKDTELQPSKIMDYMVIEYFPVLGEKSCYKCMEYRIFKTNAYCVLKGIKVYKNSSYQCLYWLEKPKVKYVHQQNRPRRYDAPNQTFPRAIKQGRDRNYRNPKTYE